MRRFATPKRATEQRDKRGIKAQKTRLSVTPEPKVTKKNSRFAKSATNTKAFMNKFFFFALLAITTITATTVSAQQDPLYSQHVYNKLPLNPGYAGSRDAISGTVLYRRQWISFPGAPNTGTFSLHSPLANRKLAVGMNVTMDEAGITSNCTVCLPHQNP